MFAVNYSSMKNMIKNCVRVISKWLISTEPIRGLISCLSMTDKKFYFRDNIDG